jgi:hypothetical protein
MPNTLKLITNARYIVTKKAVMELLEPVIIFKLTATAILFVMRLGAG